MSSGLSISIDRSAEFHIDARVRVTIPTAAGPMVTLSATCGGVTTTHTGAKSMGYTLPADKKVELQISYVDSNGNPAPVDGAVRWVSSDENIARIEQTQRNIPAGEPEGGRVMLVPGVEVGNCQITAKADADLGEGVEELLTLMDVTVVGGRAVSGTITPVGEQIPK